MRVLARRSAAAGAWPGRRRRAFERLARRGPQSLGCLPTVRSAMASPRCSAGASRRRSPPTAPVIRGTPSRTARFSSRSSPRPACSAATSSCNNFTDLDPLADAGSRLGLLELHLRRASRPRLDDPQLPRAGDRGAGLRRPRWRGDRRARRRARHEHGGRERPFGQLRDHRSRRGLRDLVLPPAGAAASRWGRARRSPPASRSASPPAAAAATGRTSTSRRTSKAAGSSPRPAPAAPGRACGRPSHRWCASSTSPTST